MQNNNKAFFNHKTNGVLLQFINGSKISSVWGYCTYSDNYNMEDVPMEKRFETVAGSDTCEIMLIDCKEQVVKEVLEKYGDKENGANSNVFGYLNIDEWLDIVNKVNK